MPCVLFCQYCLLSNTESKEITDTVNKAYYNCFKFSINVVIMSQISYCSNCEVKICDNPGLRVKLRAQRVTQRTSTWKTEACSVWSQSQQWLVFISVYEARTRVTKHKREERVAGGGVTISPNAVFPLLLLISAVLTDEWMWAGLWRINQRCFSKCLKRI